MIQRLILALLLLLPMPAMAQNFPPLTGRVVDQANLLPPQQEAELTQRLEAVERASSRQLVVATVTSLEGREIEEYGYQLGRHWGLGQSQANNGLILLVAPNERKVRIEVGYGLEGIMTDALSHQIIQQDILPRFRQDDYAGGIMAGTDALIQQLQAPPEAAEQRALEAASGDVASGDQGEGSSILPIIFWIVVLAFIFVPLLKNGFRGRRYRGRRRGAGPIVIWGPGMGGWSSGSSSSGWGSGGGSSWGGGGGFSGGGGSFGGGGASGGMVTMPLSDEDRAMVAAAVAKAERESDGEIVPIVASRSDAYHDVGLHFAVLAMLIVPGLLAVLPQGSIDRAVALAFGWNADLGRGALMLGLFVLLALAFLIVRYALAWMPLRLALTPGRTKTRRVHRRAIELFRVGCEQKTHGRTGVLIYLSLAERRAEIVADKAISDKVEPDVWGEAMAALVDEVKAGRPGAGLAGAVERVGAVLATILPPTLANPNELPDRVIEL